MCSCSWHVSVAVLVNFSVDEVCMGDSGSLIIWLVYPVSFFVRVVCLLMLPAGLVTKPYIESDASTWCDPRSFFLNSILGGLLFPIEEIVFLFLLFSNMLSNYFTLSINNLGK